MIIDIRTLMLLYFIVNVINVGAIVVVLSQYQKRFQGISLWLASMVCQALGIGLILLRNILPDIITIVFANTLFVLGIIFLLIGLEEFIGVKRAHTHDIVLLFLFMFSMYFFDVLRPNLSMREILISLMIAVFNIEIAWLLFRKVPPGFCPTIRMTGPVVGGYILASLTRIFFLVIAPRTTSDFFDTSLIDSFTITIYISLSICMIVILISLVTRRLLNEIQLQEEKFNKAFHSAPYAILLTRLADGKILDVNEGFTKIIGYQIAEVLGKSTLDLHLWVTDQDRYKFVENISKNKKIDPFEQQFRKKSGELMTGLFSSETIEINKEELLLSSIGDITELSQIKQQLQIEATHDHLTGLPNRKLFYDRFLIAQAFAQRYRKHLAILSLDLDNFKEVNDTLGHDAGDQVLIEVAKRLTTVLRKVDTIARFGGDEFVLLLSEIKQRENVVEVTQKIMRSFQSAIQIDDHEFFLSASIGIALYPDDGDYASDLIKKSDKALYYVKRNGRNNFCFYDDLPENDS
jgi:diguanylate cyclase (GGDEF)-like protein/PAS domain S-box-containing protein